MPANDMLDLARLDRGLTFVVNNDWELCNRLVDAGCLNVICRIVDTAYDPYPILTDDPNENRRRGQVYFFESTTGAGRNRWDTYSKLNPKVKLIYINEWQHPKDGPFTEGLILSADSVGARLVNFNDAVGNPHMWREGTHPVYGFIRSDNKALPQDAQAWLAANGVWRSPGWEQRKEAFRLCLQWPNGRARTLDEQHYVGHHTYGASPHHLMVDPVNWDWYAGRFVGLYETVPYHPMLYLTECGPFDATNPGVDHVMRDIESYEAALQKYPYVKGFAYWTLGIWSVTNAGVNESIGAFKAYLQR